MFARTFARGPLSGGGRGGLSLLARQRVRVDMTPRGGKRIAPHNCLAEIREVPEVLGWTGVMRRASRARRREAQRQRHLERLQLRHHIVEPLNRAWSVPVRPAN